MPSYLRTNYQTKANPDTKKITVASKEDFERLLMQYIGGSYVYIRPKKDFIVMGNEQEKGE